MNNNFHQHNGRTFVYERLMAGNLLAVYVSFLIYTRKI
ncbi:Hypothetical protein EAG7_01801 [Klebsiella aerogenes]|nr:Hypothetical protein EAG7_01801 [Klebsiella aerogenes]CCG30277.1 hypothetical protein [Klebsiella aerogenes EA1509E]